MPEPKQGPASAAPAAATPGPLAAIAESDEAFARCARCDRPERAPGSAALLRAALKDVLDHAPFATDHATMLTGGNDLLARLRHAYYAPARNCDRFKNAEEAEEAFVKFCGFAMNGKIPYWKCPPNCGHTGPDGWVTCCIRWLFAPAKGGDHA